MIRHGFVEYGVLQLIARAKYLHRWETGESGRNANFIVNTVASNSDVRRYISVLETLVNLSTQLSSTDIVSCSTIASPAAFDLN